MTLARLELTKWQPASKRSPGHLPRLRPNPYPSRAAPLILPRPRNIPALPNEIIAQILESLGEETYDPATGTYEQEDDSAYDYLETCCLVSHAFLHKAREIMHREVVLYGGGHFGGHYKIIYDRLIRFPHLAARVHQLHLRHLTLGPENGSEWLPDTKGLLRVCTAVEDVTFSCGDTADLVRYIEAVHDACAKLKRVSITGGGRSSDDEHSAGIAFSSLLRRQVDLKSLTFQGRFDWVGDGPTFELEELKIADSKYTESGFETLTKSSRLSLRHLTLLENKYMTPPERNLASFVPDFSLFTNLHTLRILDPPKDLTAVYPHLEHLPLRHLYITEYSSPYSWDRSPRPTGPLPHTTNPLSFLPQTLIVARLQIQRHTDLVAFLEAGSCPNLASGTFLTSQKLDPWSRQGVERVVRDRGLEIVEKEPWGWYWSDDEAEEDE